MHPVIGDCEDPHFNGVRAKCREHAQDYPETVTDFQLRHDDRKAVQKFVVNNYDECNDNDVNDKDGEQCTGLRVASMRLSYHGFCGLSMGKSLPIFTKRLEPNAINWAHR